MHSYRFALTEGEQVAIGLIQKNEKGFYWSTDDANEPSLWVGSKQVVILDQPFQVATLWTVEDFEQLHPFIGAWFWLSQIENEAFEQPEGSFSLCERHKGCFQLDWTLSTRNISWNGGQVRLTIQTQDNIKESQFDFKIPSSWEVEQH